MISQLIESLETRRMFIVDLICWSIGVNSYDASTASLTFSTTFTNTGTTPVPEGTINKVFLSKDNQVNNGDDVTIGLIENRVIPTTGTLKTITDTLTVNNVPAGTYFFGVAFDAGNTVNEPDNLNNYKFASTKITVPDTFDVVINGTAGKDTIVVWQSGSNFIAYLNETKIWDINADRVASVLLLGNDSNDVINAKQMLIPVTAEGGDGKDYISGGAGADTLSGNAGPDYINGYGSNDRINGNGGNDSLYGEGGADRIYGYDGNDYIDGGSSNDRLEGDGGRDTLYGQGGDDHFFTKDGTIDQLFGGTGTDDAERDSFDIVQSISA